VTNVLNAETFEPSEDSIYFEIETSNGWNIESQYTGMNISNSIYSVPNVNTAGVTPDDFEQSILSNYTITFSPDGYS
jgi:hypothetical protein